MGNNYNDLSIYDQTYLSDGDKETMLNIKKMYQQNPDNGQLYNKLAEQLRSKYGYSGGTDGSQYIEIQKGMPDFDFNSSYESLITNSLSEYLEYEPFEYNPSKDKSYQAFLQKAKRLGNEAYANNLGGLSSATGGRPNSWASSVASQSRNNYMLQASEAMGQFEQMAYGRWKDERSMLRDDLDIALKMDDRDYGRYLDSYNMEIEAYKMEIEEKAKAVREAWDRTQLLGYVSNEDSVLLGVPAGTLSQQARERAEKMEDWFTQQEELVRQREAEVEKEFEMFKKKEDYKHGIWQKQEAIREANSSSGGSNEKPIPQKSDQRERDSVIKGFDSLVNKTYNEVEFSRLPLGKQQELVENYVDNFTQDARDGLYNEWVVKEIQDYIMNHEAYKKIYGTLDFMGNQIDNYSNNSNFGATMNNLKLEY